ncbi:putative urea carboxylase [Meyerozyma sp. JA9]|nr:putative urea carboxylase [Meyerozyma sp. JA9]
MAQFRTLKRVLVANRGEIACRTIRCCKENGLQSIAIYSAEDAESLHVLSADEAVLLPGVGAQAYIDIDHVVSVAISSKADVVVPGYGFLSESPQFAASLEEKGVVFAGPTGKSIDTFGLKHSARSLAESNDVPVVPGSGLVTDIAEAQLTAKSIGYPVMLKSTAGGGGMGLKVCYREDELSDAFKEVVSRGETLFNNSGAFLEKYVECGRHIEVQVFGNGQGYVRAFGERECSIQRRHQKVIEESPSPFVENGRRSLRKQLVTCAAQLAASVNYKSAGTVEFLVDDETGSFYFLEMNTRLQVEHGITELVYGIDLVKLMLLQADYEARGEPGIPESILEREGECETDSDGVAIPRGHAIECRVYAENPVKNFQPAPGVLHFVEFPEEVEKESKLRIDHWISTGSKVSPYFDPLLAKVMVWAPSRDKARLSMIQALSKSHIQGPTHNIDYLAEILKSSNFSTGKTLTTFLTTDFEYQPNLIEFVKPGSYTTIQDYPGREDVGHGVPLSGPSDPLFFQLANIIVGNNRSTEGLEVTLKGPTIRAHAALTICLAGGKFKFTVNGAAVPMFTAISVPAGSVISVGKAQGGCARAYLAIKGGLPEVAQYLGSKSCTPTLNLGGHQGRPIMDGDCLSVIREDGINGSVKLGFELPQKCKPDLDMVDDDFVWTIRTTGGPHDTADICSKEGLEMFYDTVYTVNLNSNRGCIRLDGPANVFSRNNGGDGGTHPSNILEYPYPSCGISIVGNVVSLFGVDGSTLSGFVCIAVPIMADWWKAGQAKVKGKIRFRQVSHSEAVALKQQQEAFLNELEKAKNNSADLPVFRDDLPTEDEFMASKDTILFHRPAGDKGVPFFIRQAGEKMLILDFGVEYFTLVKNGRQRVLEMKLKEEPEGSLLAKSLIRIECSSGAMGVIYEPTIISQSRLVEILCHMERDIPPTDSLKIESTLYRLPICFDHSSIAHCMERYMRSQRSQAPYLPDNTAYLMKANCIDSLEQFKANVVDQTQVVTAVSFLCANTLSVNLDPRKRFKTGKFNPARTFTPKGALGSGSVGYSIYSIDSPGGYLIWGMGLPDLCWNTFGRLQVSHGRPWFFNNFDQIVYYEVDEKELTKLNRDLLLGNLDIPTEKSILDFSEYSKFLRDIKDELKELNDRKAKVMSQLLEEEDQSLAQWIKECEKAKNSNPTGVAKFLQDPSAIKVTCSMAANVFKIYYKPGEHVGISDTIIMLEAMKMEIAVKPAGGDEDESDDEGESKAAYNESSRFEILEVAVNEGDVVSPGTVLAFLRLI